LSVSNGSRDINRKKLQLKTSCKIVGTFTIAVKQRDLETVKSWNETVKCSGNVLLSEIKTELCNFSVRLLFPAIS
jgi:hypothetical protein